MITVAPPARILYVVSRWQAPTQTFVRREVDAARAAGRDIIVLSLKRPARLVAGDPPVVHLAPLRVPVLALRTLLRHPIRSVGALGRAVAGSRPATLGPNVVATVVGLAGAAAVPPVDWVHAHFAWVAATTADALASTRRAPFSIFAHAHDVFAADVIDRLTGRKLRRSAFVAVESPTIQRAVDERFGCRSVVARMGLSPELLDRPASASRSATPTIVSVGSLVPKKGHDDLLRALALLPAEVQLVVAGGGPEGAALAALAALLGVADRVDWLGPVPEDAVIDLLDGATVFALASKPTATGDSDGVPNVLIEAMGRGIPCVSTSVAGIPDLLGDGRGIVVPPAAPEALAAAIAGLLADPAAASAMATSGRQHVAEGYRTDRNWLRLEALMQTHGVAA